MNEFTSSMRCGLRRLLATLLASTVLASAAFAQAPNVCQLAPDGKLGSIGVSIEQKTTSTSFTINSVFEFAPVPGVRKYTLTIVEFSPDTSPATLGRSFSLDLDNPPARFDEYQLNFFPQEGVIRRVNIGAGAHISNGDAIAQAKANIGAITGRAEIRCTGGREGIEITNFRYQPGSPFPGYFGTMRGTVTNVGTSTVTGIDFSFTSTPEVAVVEPALAGLDPSVSPRIASLAPGQAHEFLVPSLLRVEVGDLQRYNVDFQMTGTSASVGTVTATAKASNALDLSFYYRTIFEKAKAFLLGSLDSLTDLVDRYAKSSTVGGIQVGTTEGVLNAFQEMGDGLLDAGSLLAHPIDTLKGLSTKGQSMAQSISEYANTHTPKQLGLDLRRAGVTVTEAGVKQVTDWFGKIETSYRAGDTREVARLLAKPATEVAVGEIVVEQAVAKLFGKLISEPVKRVVNKTRKRAPDVPKDSAGEVDWGELWDNDVADLKDMPTGVQIDAATVARAGLAPDEFSQLQQIARKLGGEEGIAFFVRPRPPEAIKWARKGYNAKPMAVKLKSVNDIDLDYLGFREAGLDGSQGLVIMREPADPYSKILADIKAGKFRLGDPQIKEIVDRYSSRKADWLAKDEYLAKLNATNDGKGITIYREGKKEFTKVSLDSSGKMTFDINGHPVYSDVDLLHVARPNGEQLPEEVHKALKPYLESAIDRQHGDTFSSADMQNSTQVYDLATQYGNEHKRGGDPLLIISAESATLGYVKDFSISPPLGADTRSGYELFGMVNNISYEGARP